MSSSPALKTSMLVSAISILSLGAFAQTPEVAAPEEVIVFGRVHNEVNLQVPQTVDVIDEHLLENIGATSIGDALRFIPGASRDGSSLDAFGDTYLMHGFYSSQTVNGIGVNRLNNARDSVNVERIDVLKGPASVLYGQLQPGAVITSNHNASKFLAVVWRVHSLDISVQRLILIAYLTTMKACVVA